MGALLLALDSMCSNVNTVTAKLQLVDDPSRRDLQAFLERLLRMGCAEVRVLSRGAVFAVFGCVQAPVGLLDPTAVVLVLRTCELAHAPTVQLDATVSTQALLDRVADRFEMPENLAAVSWAGALPPLSGWHVAGVIDAESLREVAAQGAARVVKLLPEQAGEAVIRAVRRSVWGLEIAPDVPAMAAFAAETMGFLREESRLRLMRSRAWLRIDSSRGQVCIRRSHL